MVISALFASVSAQRGAAPVPAPISPLLRDYQPVTAERLKNPEDQNWLMIRAKGKWQRAKVRAKVEGSGTR